MHFKAMNLRDWQLRPGGLGVPRWHNGLRIQHCHCCGSGYSWPWVQSLAPQLLLATSVAKKKKKKKKTWWPGQERHFGASSIVLSEYYHSCHLRSLPGPCSSWDWPWFGMHVRRREFSRIVAPLSDWARLAWKNPTCSWNLGS